MSAIFMVHPDNKESSSVPSSGSIKSPRSLSWCDLCLAAIALFALALKVSVDLYSAGIGLKCLTLRNVLIYLALGSIGVWAFTGILPRVKKLIVAAFFNIAAIEILLQMLVCFHLLPSISFLTHVPYGRIYWTKEGFEHSLMNRYGWHSRNYAEHKKGYRIAVIGDSFIDALTVSKSSNFCVQLESMIKAENKCEGVEVIPLGCSGAGPAQYFEMVKYAFEYLEPDEILVVVYEGNDVLNSSFMYHKPGVECDYIYYSLEPDGDVKLRPESRNAQRMFVSSMRMNHRALPFVLGQVVMSNIILLPVVKQILARIGHSRNADDEPLSRQAGRRRFHGIDEFIFKNELSEHATNAFAIAEGLLSKCQQVAMEKHVPFKLVAIPFFPADFYTKFTGTEWRSDFDGYDFLMPEKKIMDYSARTGIPFVGVGAEMHNRRVPAENIQRLYSCGGTGHFSPEGHGFMAKVLFDRFYNKGAAEKPVTQYAIGKGLE